MEAGVEFRAEGIKLVGRCSPGIVEDKLKCSAGDEALVVGEVVGTGRVHAAREDAGCLLYTSRCV